MILRHPSTRRRWRTVATLALAIAIPYVFIVATAKPEVRWFLALIGFGVPVVIVLYAARGIGRSRVEIRGDRLSSRHGSHGVVLNRTSIGDIWIAPVPSPAGPAWLPGMWVVMVTADGEDHALLPINGGAFSQWGNRPSSLERIAEQLRRWVATGTLPDTSGG